MSRGRPASGHRASGGGSKLRLILSICGKAAESRGSKRPPSADHIMPGTHILTSLRGGGQEKTEQNGDDLSK